MQNNTFSGLFIGQKFVLLPSVDSTNNYLKNELSKSAPLPSGTVILAEHQYAGRGQVNNIWFSEPGKNLTFSILLDPSFLSPDTQFLLNKAVSIAINESLTEIIGSGVKIKWPNDIYVNNSKLGGVLIENIIQGTKWKHAIVGIGININQTEFPDCVRNVTSLKNILGKEYDVNIIMSAICLSVERQFLLLRSSKAKLIHEEYLKRLYRLGETHLFRVNGEELQGKICDVGPSGLMDVEFLGNRRTFGFKEIEFII